MTEHNQILTDSELLEIGQRIDEEYSKLLKEADVIYKKIRNNEEVTKEERAMQSASWKQLELMKRSFKELMKMRGVGKFSNEADDVDFDFRKIYKLHEKTVGDIVRKTG